MVKAPLRVETILSPNEVAKAMNGKWLGKIPTQFAGVALDTRAVQPGDLFFALNATRDGHEFVTQAFEKGAAACVVHQDVKTEKPLLRVADTQEALFQLALFARTHWGKTVVAVGGSNGKTTTKEVTAAILNAHQSTLKTPGTWNNHLGVPLTTLLLRPSHSLAVMELGINDFGEMTQLCKVAKPNVALLTNIGPEHLEKFGSIDGVAKAERELFEALPENGTVIVNADDPKIVQMVSAMKCRQVRVSLRAEGDVTASVIRDHGPEGLTLQVHYGKEVVELKTPLLGVHNVYNLLCALGTAYALSVPKEKLQLGINQIERPEMRLQTFKLPRGICIVNDCYNANPASTMVALEVVQNMTTGRTIAILGDMLELGDYSARAHRDVGIRVAGHKYAYLIALGRFAGDLRQGAIQGGMKESQIKVFKTHQEAVDLLSELTQPGDTILVKGSRGMKLENISEPLMAKLKEATN